MKNLETFNLYEGDPWEWNRWNYGTRSENELAQDAIIQYPETQRDFVVLGIPGEEAILKKKSDNSLWVLDVTDISDDFEDYLYQYVADGDESERAEGYEVEEYASIATDIFKNKNYLKGKGAWEDRDGWVRLFEIDLPLAEVLIEDYVDHSRQRDRKYSLSTSDMNEYKKAASVLSKAFPEA